MKPNRCSNSFTDKKCSCGKSWACNNITVEHIESLTDDEMLDLV